MPTAPGFATCSYELRHSLLTRSAFITFGIDPPGTDVQGMADAIQAAFATAGSLLVCIDSNVTMVASRVSYGTDGAADLVGQNNVTVACTNTGSSLPPNVAVLVHKRTARGGRRGRGRMYLPWAAATTTPESGATLSADIARVSSAFTIWRTHLAANAGPLVLLHRPSAPGVEHPTAAGAPDPVTAHTVDTIVATQRRRLGR